MFKDLVSSAKESDAGFFASLKVAAAAVVEKVNPA